MEFNSDEETKHWLPGYGKKSLCTRCHINHEAQEFVDALISTTSSLFLESKEFVKFQREATQRFDVKPLARELVTYFDGISKK